MGEIGVNLLWNTMEKVTKNSRSGMTDYFRWCIWKNKDRQLRAHA